MSPEKSSYSANQDSNSFNLTSCLYLFIILHTRERKIWGIKLLLYALKNRGNLAGILLAHSERQCPPQGTYNLKKQGRQIIPEETETEACSKRCVVKPGSVTHSRKRTLLGSQVQQSAALDSWNQLHPSLVWKGLYLEQKKREVFKNLLSLYALEYWNTWKEQVFISLDQKYFKVC